MLLKNRWRKSLLIKNVWFFFKDQWLHLINSSTDCFDSEKSVLVCDENWIFGKLMKLKNSFGRERTKEKIYSRKSTRYWSSSHSIELNKTFRFKRCEKRKELRRNFGENVWSIEIWFSFHRRRSGHFTSLQFKLTSVVVPKVAILEVWRKITHEQSSDAISACVKVHAVTWNFALSWA